MFLTGSLLCIGECDTGLGYSWSRWVTGTLYLFYVICSFSSPVLSSPAELRNSSTVCFHLTICFGFTWAWIKWSETFSQISPLWSFCCLKCDSWRRKYMIGYYQNTDRIVWQFPKQAIFVFACVQCELQLVGTRGAWVLSQDPWNSPVQPLDIAWTSKASLQGRSRWKKFQT